MADNLPAKMRQLRQAVLDLKAREGRLKARNAELSRENAELRRRAAAADEARRRTELDVEYLRVSHRLADSPDSIIEARRMIAKLIRNIDRCLEMLKE